MGARILSEANDLKRTPEALAADIDVDPKNVLDAIAGTAPAQMAENIILRMAEHYPISLADIWVEKNDTDHGVTITREAESKKSSRIFDRIDRHGACTPYYDYRDTAMSSSAPYKPEWIRELRVVSDNSPDNPDVAFNNGHLMHQITFFVGEVNFYWKAGEKAHCAVMNTGDSNYITPFVPHSFASRNPEKPGLIIAVTYGALVRRALTELSSFTTEKLEYFVGDLRNLQSAISAKINFIREAESLSVDQLVERLSSLEIEITQARNIVQGHVLPSEYECRALAGALGVKPTEFLLKELEGHEEVVVKKIAESQRRPVRAENSVSYYLTELARSVHQPLLRSFEMTVPKDQSRAADICHGLYEYIYNYGEQPVEMSWGENRVSALNPGDSACIHPMISHRFENVAGEAHLIVVRIPGAFQGATIEELSAYPVNARARVVEEQTRWY
jgi:methylphosphonate synthase